MSTATHICLNTDQVAHNVATGQWVVSCEKTAKYVAVNEYLVDTAISGGIGPIANQMAAHVCAWCIVQWAFAVKHEKEAQNG